MEIPSELQFEEAISEIKMSSELNHLHGNKEDGCCDLCRFCKEINSRGREAQLPTELDKVALSILQSSAGLGLLAATVPEVMDTVLTLVRVGCLIGYKVRVHEHGVSELEKMVNLE